MHWLNEGPYTGQTSPTMLVSIGCRHVLLGHSEQRLYFNETYERVNLKLKAAINHGITPIVCVGELLAEREDGEDGRDAPQPDARRAAEHLCYRSSASRDRLRTHLGDRYGLHSHARRSPRKPTPSSAASSASAAGKRPRTTLASCTAARSSPTTSARSWQQEEIDGALVGGASLVPDDVRRTSCITSQDSHSCLTHHARLVHRPIHKSRTAVDQIRSTGPKSRLSLEMDR